MKKNKRNAFILLELMVTLMIMGTLVSYMVPKYHLTILKARSTQCFASRKNAENAEQIYMMEHDNQVADLNTLVSQGYLAKKPFCTEGGTLLWVSTSPLKLACSVHDITSPVPASDPNLFFSSDFNNLNGMKIVSGTWYTKDGSLYNSSRYAGQIFVSTAPLANYSVKVNANLLDGNGYGVYYRASLNSANQISGYCFQFDPGLGNKFVIRKVTNGVESPPIVSYNMPPGYPVYNTEHQIEIQASGSQSTIYIDGKKILQFTDSSYSSGLTGFRNWSGYSSFDSIELRKL